MGYIQNIYENTATLTIKPNLTKTEQIFTNLSCLTEEVGELAAEIRKMTQCSFSQKKCDAFRMEDLEDEACDVLITLSLLLKSVGVESLDTAIERKIGKNQARGY